MNATDTENIRPKLYPKASSLKRLLSFLESLQFSIWLFSLLIFSSLMGALIPQKETSFYYSERYGPATAELLQKASLNNVFESYWFIFILMALCTSTLVCVHRRCRILFSSLNSHEMDDSFSPKTVIELGNKTFSSESLCRILRENRYRSIHIRQISDTEIDIIGRKYLCNRYGTLLAHISVVIILIGALIGMEIWPWSFNYSLSVRELQKVVLPHTPYTLEFTKYEEEYYPGTQSPSDFRSHVSLWEGSTIKTEQIIRVNHPMKYGFLGIFQNARNPIEGPLIAEFIIKDPKTRSPLSRVRGIAGQVVEIPPSHVKAVIEARMESNYSIRELNKKEGSQQYVYEFAGVSSPWISTFEVVQDPGIPIVYFGFSLLLVGLFLGLCFEYRKVGIKYKLSEGTSLIYIGGDSCRKNNHLQDDIKMITRAIKELNPEKRMVD